MVWASHRWKPLRKRKRLPTRLLVCLRRLDRPTVKIRFRLQVYRQCRLQSTATRITPATHHRTRGKTLLQAIRLMINNIMPVEADTRTLLHLNNRRRCTIQCLAVRATREVIQVRVRARPTQVTRITLAIQTKAAAAAGTTSSNNNIPATKPTSILIPTINSSTHLIRIHPIVCIRRLIQNHSVLRHHQVHHNHKDRQHLLVHCQPTIHMVDTCRLITFQLGLTRHLDLQHPLLYRKAVPRRPHRHQVQVQLRLPLQHQLLQHRCQDHHHLLLSTCSSLRKEVRVLDRVQHPAQHQRPPTPNRMNHFR